MSQESGGVNLEPYLTLSALITYRCLLLKNQPRFCHISHRYRDEFPSSCAKFVQLGLHVLSVGKDFDDSVLKPFWLLRLDDEGLAKDKHEPQGPKAESSYRPRDRDSYGQHRSPRIGCRLGLWHSQFV